MVFGTGDYRRDTEKRAENNGGTRFVEDHAGVRALRLGAPTPLPSSFFLPLSYVRVSLKGSGRLMPFVLLGPSNLVDSENCATNEEVDPDAVALSAFFDLYPNQQEAYEESVARKN